MRSSYARVLPLVVLLAAGSARAEDAAAMASLPLEFSLALGQFQRSAGTEVDFLTRGNLVPEMSTADFGEISALAYLASLRVPEHFWVRGLFSEATQSATKVGPNGMGFRLQNTVFGVLGAVVGTGVAGRDTSIMAIDGLVPILDTDTFDVHVGGKYAQLGDSLYATITGGGFTSSGRFDATSTFGGPVLAVEYRLGPPDGTAGLGLSVFASAALLASAYDQSYELVNNTTRTATASLSDVSGSAELGVTASYAFGPQASIEATAHVVYYSDVASAPLAPAQSTLGSPGTTAVATEEAWYSGLSVTGKVRF